MAATTASMLISMAARLRGAFVIGLVIPASSFRLITLDLDNTLWPTAPVVAVANAALCSALRADHGVELATPAAVQQEMKRLRPLLEARGRRRSPGDGGDRCPVTYTQLRTAAIAHLLGDRPDAADAASQLFDVWLAARHAAAQDQLFPEATSALCAMRAAYPDAIVAAVTNGRGDPRVMSPALARCFDLTVSGEEPGIHPGRKPSPTIFRAAVARAGLGPRLVPGQPLPWWVHVGDDIFNDVAASKALGAKTVWLDAPRQEAGDGVGLKSARGERQASTDADASYTTLEQSERRTRQAQRAAVPASAVDARITAIAELPRALAAIASGFNAHRPHLNRFPHPR